MRGSSIRGKREDGHIVEEIQRQQKEGDGHDRCAAADPCPACGPERTKGRCERHSQYRGVNRKLDVEVGRYHRQANGHQKRDRQPPECRPRFRLLRCDKPATRDQEKRENVLPKKVESLEGNLKLRMPESHGERSERDRQCQPCRRPVSEDRTTDGLRKEHEQTQREKRADPLRDQRQGG